MLNALSTLSQRSLKTSCFPAASMLLWGVTCCFLSARGGESLARVKRGRKHDERGGRLLRHIGSSSSMRSASIDVVSKVLPTPLALLAPLAPLATLTRTAQDESAYGAPSKCSLERFEHVLQLSLHRWNDKDKAEKSYCFSSPRVTCTSRPPAIHAAAPCSYREKQ